MPFFARPNLDDIQFKQISGTTLTLSGQTRIANPTGLTLTDGAGGYVPIIATGGTNYDVLTYCNGLITLQPQSGGGSGVYSGSSPTTCSVGGLVAGTPIAGCSISKILEEILVPALPLSATLSVLTPASSTSRQFGDNRVGNLCWCVVKGTNNTCDIFLSTNGTGTYNCTKLSGGSISANTGGTVSYTYSSSCASPTTATTNTSVSYLICAKSCDSCTSTSNTNITWQNKKYVFCSSTLYNSSTISPVLSATTGTLSSSKALTCTMTLSNQFFYYAYPKNLGTPSFTVNGLPNNAWGNASTGTLFTATFVNSNGYSSPYYVARSDNKITGSYNIIVS